MNGKTFIAAGQRQDRQQKNQDSHTAQPMGETAPVQQASAHRLDIQQNGRSRGRKAGDDLK